jgi:CelD/BcsL family acetyltransferase involved in cellulose biosynthesis
MSTSTGTLRVLDAGRDVDRAVWLELWRKWPEREAFAHPAYVALNAQPGTRPLAAVLESSRGCVLFPFLLRDLEREPYCRAAHAGACDVVSPYGYGGAFAWGSDAPDALASAFWTEWEGWARGNGVVCEFLRLNLFEDRILPYPGERERKQQNVVRDLAPAPGDLWKDYRHKVRKNVNRARAEGVAIEVDPAGERLAGFAELYERTMDRRQAGGMYYFGKPWFDSLLRGLGDGAVLFHALWKDRIVSTELVLVSAENIYSFLGGTDPDAFAARPNDLLKHHIILWGREQGKRRFVLGGGFEPNDGIFRYKASFAPGGEVPFHVGRRIHDPAVYEDLIARRRRHEAEQGRAWEPRSDYFPAYRV